MNKSELHSFIEFVKSALGETINESGTLLYSSHYTLKKGKFLILGLNPGGDPNEPNSSILNSISNIENINYNGYYEDWNDGKTHRLQENLKAIANALNENLRDICATNLLFTRTRDESGINWVDLPKFLSIISKIIGIVSPEIIITFGKVPFYKLREYYLSNDYLVTDHRPEKSGHGNWVIRYFESSGLNKVKVIGLPHLSIYTIYNRPDKLKWLANQAK